MNIIENDYIIVKSFIVENVFASSILSTVFAFMISNKIIKFFTKTFKIMQLNNVKMIITNDIQQIINFNLYQFIAIVFFIITIIINNAKDSL